MGQTIALDGDPAPPAALGAQRAQAVRGAAAGAGAMERGAVEHHQANVPAAVRRSNRPAQSPNAKIDSAQSGSLRAGSRAGEERP
ncbi:MAG TPA: hypothetical protein VGE16_18325 [Albitalea sp.]